jgi:hypothetical protein
MSETLLPKTADRVPQHTDEDVNRGIREEAKDRVVAAASEGAGAIDRRLRELEREWDIERVLETNAASIALAGLGLGLFADRRFMALPAIVAGFLLQHALQGWCPPVPVFRRLGVRTQREIDDERAALKALRGDFEGISEQGASAPERGRRAFEAASK